MKMVDDVMNEYVRGGAGANSDRYLLIGSTLYDDDKRNRLKYECLLSVEELL